jgi:hypothetical protein
VLRIVDIVILERYDKRRPRAGYIAQPAEAGWTVFEAKVLPDV